MKFPCAIHAEQNAWTAEHQSDDLGLVTAHGVTREECLRKLVGEIRYRLELCPCSGESYQHIEVEVVADESARK